MYGSLGAKGLNVNLSHFIVTVNLKYSSPHLSVIPRSLGEFSVQIPTISGFQDAHSMTQAKRSVVVTCRRIARVSLLFIAVYFV
jgi:hypothetical protein